MTHGQPPGWQPQQQFPGYPQYQGQPQAKPGDPVLVTGIIALVLGTGLTVLLVLSMGGSTIFGLIRGLGGIVVLVGGVLLVRRMPPGIVTTAVGSGLAALMMLVDLVVGLARAGFPRGDGIWGFVVLVALIILAVVLLVLVLRRSVKRALGGQVAAPTAYSQQGYRQQPPAAPGYPQQGYPQQPYPGQAYPQPPYPPQRPS